MPTHGSLTKAGKVRGQTPKVESQGKKRPIPKVRNHRNYVKLLANAGREDYRKRRR